MGEFVGGALTLGYLVVGLFFLRFWRITRDRLFALFSLAFWLMGMNRLLISIVQIDDESLPYLYLVRLFAYILIIYGIVDKNRTRSALETPKPTAGE